MVFLSSFLQYLIIMLILVVIAFVGFKCGIALRKRKDAKEALSAEDSEPVDASASEDSAEE